MYISALHGPGFGSKPCPALYIILQARLGLDLHTAGPGRAWSENNLNTSGLGRAGPGPSVSGPGLDIIKIFIQKTDYYFIF